jgi:tetratricopeptide (TPR) repeat protein
MNWILHFVFLIFILSACGTKKVVNSKDYSVFLSDPTRNEKQLKKIAAESEFWQNRLSKDTGNFVDMCQLASVYINDLHVADSFYAISLQKTKNSDPEIYFSISQNAITQHRFNEAWKNLLIADSIGADPYLLRLLKFDAAMEIGLYAKAASFIENIRRKNDFDCLIRKAKLEDHYGRLDNAISLMEIALKKAESNGNKSTALWAKTNLADMYGHAGRIKDAYRNYIDVLQKDSNNLYALKGIAWIAYSHDHNTKEAKRIINYILSQTKMPELYLQLAEMDEWEGNEVAKKENINKFLSEAIKPGYENMYNKYLINIYAEEIIDLTKALSLAQKEVSNRPTPETYSWLAWVYFRKGDKEKAYDLVKDFVIGRNFEPEAQLHMAYILKSKGETKKAQELLNECLESSFELGPVVTSQIKKQI